MLRFRRLAGPHAKSVVIDTRVQRWFVVVEFRDGGASWLLSMPMSEIANQIVQLQDVWRSDGSLLRERLLYARTPAAKFRIIEEVLLHHHRPEFDSAIQYAVTSLRPASRFRK